ncbi:MAG: hypothetical protein Q8876_04150 [Bacillota bacterium]|nr:hypothetical protein [Bacillota bacterium]
MQDMIAKIVEMDEKARELTENAQQDKINIQKEIEVAKKKIYDDYIARAQERIKKNIETEKHIAAEKWNEIEKKNAEILQSLDESYKKNADIWADEIVKRVLAK